MIIIAGSSTTPRTNHYCHHKDTVIATESMVIETGDCCWCSCDTIIPAFADLENPSNVRQNDFYSWILKVPTNASVVATLTNLDTSTNYIITDNTYGLYFDVDDLKASVWGFRIIWNNVADLIGFGNYSLNITVTSVASVVIFNKDYPTFSLMPYSCDFANRTVRIETHNSGYIEGGFDYRNINVQITNGMLTSNEYFWKQQIRWYGRLDVTGLPVQIDNLSDNYRNLLQVQTQISREYSLSLEFIKTDISNQIVFDNLLADFVILNDYNSNNVDDYTNVKVSLLSIESPQNLKNKTIIYNIKFVDYRQNLLKRFY